MSKLGRFLVPALVAAGLVGSFVAPAAADWPKDKPITIVVPWPAGSGGDVQARIIADELSKRWDTQVIVENRAGASGNIGQAYVARAEPDGYTFIHTSPGPGANNLLTFKSLTFNPLTDFDAVTLTNEAVMVVVGRPDNPNFKDIKGLLEFAKANPGKINFGHPGVGTYAHMTELALQDMAGVEFNLVPYRGSPPMQQDLLGGQIDVLLDQAPAYYTNFTSGRMVPLAVVSESRDPRLPDVPTFKELGIDFTSAPWYGMQVPKGTPRHIIDEANKQMVDILMTDAEPRQKMIAAGLTPTGSTPEGFGKIITDEVEKWRPIVTKYNITSE